MKPTIPEPAVSQDENIYSISISDLMSALLLIFILLLSGTLLKLSEQETEKQHTILQLKEQQEKNAELLGTISEQEKAKRSIIAQLEGEMDQFDIEVVPETGAIRIKEAVLFDFGKFELKPEGGIFLYQFIPKYAKILLAKQEIRKQIAQIIIEGHTDNIGGYSYNMKLSLDRADSVASYIYSEKFGDFEHKDIFQEKLSVNGRSYMNPISDNDTDENRRKNRRVEFKFSFKDWTTLQNEELKNIENLNHERRQGNTEH